MKARRLVVVCRAFQAGVKPLALALALVALPGRAHIRECPEQAIPYGILILIGVGMDVGIGLATGTSGVLFSDIALLSDIPCHGASTGTPPILDPVESR